MNEVSGFFFVAEYRCIVYFVCDFSIIIIINMRATKWLNILCGINVVRIGMIAIIYIDKWSDACVDYIERKEKTTQRIVGIRTTGFVGS